MNNAPPPLEGADIQRGLLRILFRGKVIDAKASNGRIVDLVVRADEKHSSLWRGFLQRLSNALYCAGDMLNSRKDEGILRVVEVMVGRHAGNDGLSDRAHLHVVQRLPVHLPNGDTSYEAFAIYEGIESKDGNFLGAAGAGLGEDFPNGLVSCAGVLNKRAGDFHIFPDDDSASRATYFGKALGGPGPHVVSIEPQATDHKRRAAGDND